MRLEEQFCKFHDKQEIASLPTDQVGEGVWLVDCALKCWTCPGHCRRDWHGQSTEIVEFSVSGVLEEELAFFHLIAFSLSLSLYNFL